MAIRKCKGTTLQVTIASVLTTVAQVIELNVGQDAIETFEADYLENSSAFIPKAQTGRSTTGDISGTLFFDQALANHAFINSTITTPASVAGKINLIGGNYQTFDIISFALGLSVRLNDGLKGNFTLQKNNPVWG